RAPAGSPLPRRAGSVAAFSLALVLALAPTTWLNTVTHDEPALVSHNSGLNFYLGNNLEWRKTMFLRPGLPFRKLVLEADPSTRGAAERNDYWWRRARDELSAHPLAWLSILGTKAVWSVNNTEIPRNEDYRCRTRAGPLAWLGRLPMRYGFVFPFAVCGAVLLGRRAGPSRLVPLSWLFLHLPLVFFLVADRYRLATWPVLSLAAAIGLAGMVNALRRRRSRPKIGWLWLLLVIPLPFLTLDSATALDPAWCVHVDGNLALMDGDSESAEGFYRQALALDPDDWGARDFLARTVARNGDLDQAVALMEPLITWFPDHYPSLYFLARTEERRGRLDRAADLMGRAFAVPGKRTNTGVRYVRLLVRAGRRSEARAVLASHPELQGNPRLKGALE
ncbi:MAG: tetratricopeptide repeat protein, partial [Oligoflexia bacterium]|nr:tetratricopeptide repeat protein [Oligoflexia bacterium]